MKNKTAIHHGRGVTQFLARHGADVTGVIEGYDRLRLRGSLCWLYQPSFMFRYLCAAGVRLKDFAGFVSGLTNRVCAAAHALATAAGRPLRPLQSCIERKETLARALAERDRITEGLIGIFSILEPCLTYKLQPDAASHQLQLRLVQGRCLHYYFYFQHAQFGFMHLRLQTWFPFQVMVCLNGRLWLARQLDRAGLDYVQRDNSFVWIKDLARAQALAHQQRHVHWPASLAPLLAQCHPLAAEICRPLALNYYWSIDQSEYATDLMFKTPAALARLYPALIAHGIQHFGTPDVLRFLGRTIPAHGHVHRLYQGTVETDCKHRPEGVRLKHFVNGNGLKLYDKHGQVLRVETTLTNPEDFRVFRAPQRTPKAAKRWRPLRKSVADAPRRAQICSAVNDRYYAALAAIPAKTPVRRLVQPLTRPRSRQHRRYRALNPWAKADAALLQTVARAEWLVRGFRNRDLRAALFAPARDRAEQRRLAGRVARRLALLRAHQLIRKVPHTHRYMLTARGRSIITALLATHTATVEQLVHIAA